MSVLHDAHDTAEGSTMPAIAAIPTGLAVPSEVARPPSRAPALRPFPGSFHFKRILVPLDGAFYAERALPYATGLARLTGAGIVLGYVSPPSLPAPTQVARRVAEEIVGHEHEPHATDMEAYLDAQRVLQAFHAPAVSVATIEDSDTAFGLRQMAEHDQSDVLVLATHARQGIARQVLGSTVDTLVEQSHLPLLIIPPNVTVPPEPPSFARVLVPLDGSEVAEHALGLLVELLQAAAGPDVTRWEVTNWQITLLSVIESRTRKGEAQTYLDEVEVRLNATGLPQGMRIAKRVLLGSAPGAIVDVADHGAQAICPPDVSTGSFDLVMMATHGRGGLGCLLYGSVARYVLPRVAAPVLLVHPTDVSM
jgi:nucleotide-binding universal stress UspA family protein